MNPTNDTSRRNFLRRSSLLATGGIAAGLSASSASAQESPEEAVSAIGPRKGNPIAVSTYSFWHFSSEVAPVDQCMRLAAEMGFDAVELLEVQMHRNDEAYLRDLKRQALVDGLALCGLSTHQGFLNPDPDVRQENIDKTISSIELAYQLGIPTLRVNTGRWRTSANFDVLMANRGIESPVEGYTDEDAYPWVIEAFEKIIPVAEKCGVVMGLENHWGLGSTPEGVLRIVDAVDSPWLAVTADTGNFLEDPYDRFEKLLPQAVFVQAKTYFGGGVWYSLDLDYARFGELLRKHNYRGYISLEFEGEEDPRTAVPKSLALLRETLTY